MQEFYTRQPGGGGGIWEQEYEHIFFSCKIIPPSRPQTGLLYRDSIRMFQFEYLLTKDYSLFEKNKAIGQISLE